VAPHGRRASPARVWPTARRAPRARTRRGGPPRSEAHPR
jgi:hypothetical protein